MNMHKEVGEKRGQNRQIHAYPVGSGEARSVVVEKMRMIEDKSGNIIW
jgi:hypothetical protein